MLFFVLNLMAVAEAACCLHCSSKSDSGCLTCMDSYYSYNSLTCLANCPYSYSVSGLECISSGSDNLIFELNFYDYQDALTRSIGNFNSRDGYNHSS